jgi:hypothetical protein
MRLRLGCKRLGSKKEYGFLGGQKPLKRRHEANLVLRSSARVEEDFGKESLITQKEKSSEGQSPRVLKT